MAKGKKNSIWTTKDQSSEEHKLFYERLQRSKRLEEEAIFQHPPLAQK